MTHSDMKEIVQASSAVQLGELSKQVQLKKQGWWESS